MKVQKTIKEYRETTHSTKAEMSRATNISTGTLYNWEIGKHSPTLTQAQKIVDFFNAKGLNISINNINFLVGSN